MSIVIKNSQLNGEAIKSLNDLIELDINASTAFRISRIIKEISSIVEDKLEAEKRILNRWVDRDENGNPIIPKDEDGNPIEGSVNITDVESYTKEMKELMDIENTINHDKINFEDLQLEKAKIIDLLKIDFLFV